MKMHVENLSICYGKAVNSILEVLEPIICKRRQPVKSSHISRAHLLFYTQSKTLKIIGNMDIVSKLLVPESHQLIIIVLSNKVNAIFRPTEMSQSDSTRFFVKW